MPHLDVLEWDYADRLQHTDKSTGANQRTYFTYDSSGQRVRKVYEHGAIVEERIYLGNFEVYRRRDAGTGGLQLQRETLHVMDDTRRVAMVETKTDDPAGLEPTITEDEPRWRYQLDDHLGSSGMEITETATVISYEEYHPYGSTAFHSAEGAYVSAKRYRYTGKEKDEETGLYYHGARYYAPWLGRWTAADPAGMVDGLDLYRYSRNNPVRFSDPGGTQSEGEKDGRSFSLNLESTVVDGKLSFSLSGSIREEGADESVPFAASGGMVELRALGAALSEGTGVAALLNQQEREALFLQLGELQNRATEATPARGEGAGVGAGGAALAKASPSGKTLRVPDSFDRQKIGAYRQGVLKGEIGRNTPTGARRAAQRPVVEEFKRQNPAPRTPAPGGRGWNVDHTVELQHDLTGRKGNSVKDLRWQDAAQNQAEGNRSKNLRKADGFRQGERAGGVARESSAGKWYNSPRFRAAARGTGRALGAYGAYQSATTVYDAAKEDVASGSPGQATAEAVATEAGGWAGAIALGAYGASLGALTGPAAPIAAPLLGLVFGAVGYYAGSAVVGGTISGGNSLIDSFY